MKNENQKLQAEYYSKTAGSYDSSHLQDDHDAHTIALAILSAFIETYNIQSILDVGAGTGRTIQYLQKKFPQLKIFGIEPVKDLREQAYKKGISEENLIDGYGENIASENLSFDLVCEFGMLHHVPKPELIVKEMLRVSKKGIFISDSNNFGQGSNISRFVKQFLNALHLWKVYNYIRTRGKSYQISEGDGLFYSYSVFNNYHLINKSCSLIHITNTDGGNINPYRSASHIALFGLKK